MFIRFLRSTALNPQPLAAVVLALAKVNGRSMTMSTVRKTLASGIYWHTSDMNQRSKRAVETAASPDKDERLAPITAMMVVRG